MHNVYMSVATAERRKPLGVRATTEQHRIISEAAAREHRSINSFVLRAALDAARAESDRNTAPHRMRSPEEIEAVVRQAQALMRQANPTRRPLVDELIAERRQEAMRD